MNEKPREAAITAWARLVRVQSLLLEQIQKALKAAGLPPLAWYDVLLELYRARATGLRQFEIGDRILLPKYNLSRLIDKLEQEGMVERGACPEDRRGNLVRITDAGGGLLRQMWPVYGAVIREQLDVRLDSAQLSQLGELLDRLIPRADSQSGGQEADE